MLLTYLYLHLALIAGIQAVNITMTYSLAQWDPGSPRISTPVALHHLLPYNIEAQCNNIEPAVCCRSPFSDPYSRSCNVSDTAYL